MEKYDGKKYEIVYQIVRKVYYKKIIYEAFFCTFYSKCKLFEIKGARNVCKKV